MSQSHVHNVQTFFKVQRFGTLKLEGLTVPAPGLRTLVVAVVLPSSNALDTEPELVAVLHTRGLTKKNDKKKKIISRKSQTYLRKRER